MSSFHEIFAVIATITAAVIFLSGLDELIVDLVFIFGWRRRNRHRLILEEIESLPEKPIAILVPAWNEEDVIAEMLQNFVETVDYREVHLLVGVYSNDEATRAAVRRIRALYHNVHAVDVGHPGPTTKSDNLNSVYQRLPSLERELGIRFEIIIQHDAEDVVHPKSMRVFNAMIPEHDFVQLPVLPLPPKLTQFTAWTYADEFSVAHIRDLRVREQIKGIVPCAGVGCGFSRRVLDELVRKRGVLFPTWSLTEDYHMAVELRRMGKKVSFSLVTLVRANDKSMTEEIVATREYFPTKFGKAVRQKSRWITGIVLQSLGTIPFKGPVPLLYCLFRDRKSLVATPVGMLANLLLIYCGTMLIGHSAGWWEFTLEDVVIYGSFTWWMVIIDAGFALEQAFVKLACVQQVFGWKQGFLSVPRTLWLNCINLCATSMAIYKFAKCKITGRPLRWAKTAHEFPDIKAAPPKRKRLGEILVEDMVITEQQLEESLGEQRRTGDRLGLVMLQLHHITERELTVALAKQLGIPSVEADPYAVPAEVIAQVPEEIALRYKIFPLRVENGIIVVGAAKELSAERRVQVLEALGNNKKIDVVMVSDSDLAFCLERGYRRLADASPPAIGQSYLARGLLTEEDLQRAVRAQRQTRRHLWEVLLEDGEVADPTLLENEDGVLYAASVDIVRDPIVESLPPGLARLLHAVPVARDGATLSIGSREALPRSVITHIEARTGLSVRQVRTPKGSLQRAILEWHAEHGDQLLFGRVLVARGVATEADIDRARADQGNFGRLGERLLARNVVNEEQLLAALSEYSGIARDDAVKPSRDLRYFLPRSLCEEQFVCPMSRDGNRITVAVSISISPHTLAEMRWKLAGFELDLALATKASIRAGITSLYNIRVVTRRKLAA